MNPPAPARIALAALLIFTASTAIGAEKKKPIAPPKTIVDPKPVRPLCPTPSEFRDAPPSQFPALLEILEKTVPKTPEEAAEVRENKLYLLYNLGIIENRTFQYEKAVSHLRAAASLCEEDSQIAEKMSLENFLADVHLRHRHYEEGIPLARKVLAYHERTLGKDSGDAIRRAHSLALAEDTFNNLKAAESLCRRVLTHREKSYGPDHEETLSPMTMLATICAEKGDNAAAEPLYQRAIRIKERLYGPDNEGTLLTIDHLANFYTDKGDFTNAEPLLKRAMETRERTLGPEHEDTCRSAISLATLYQKRGEFAKGLPLAEQALKAWMKSPDRWYLETTRAKKLVDDLKKN